MHAYMDCFCLGISYELGRQAKYGYTNILNVLYPQADSTHTFAICVPHNQ